MQTQIYHQQILTEPLNDRKSFKSTSSEKGGCRATRFIKRFRALLLDSMNSRSATGRNTKFQLIGYKVTVAQKEKKKTLSSNFLILTNLAKALGENQRMVTDTVSSLKHIFGLTTRTTIPSSDTSYITEISCTYIHVFISTGQVK